MNGVNNRICLYSNLAFDYNEIVNNRYYLNSFVKLKN